MQYIKGLEMVADLQGKWKGWANLSLKGQV